MVAYVAVNAELEILSKSKALDARNIANVEEPNIGKNFAFPDVSCHKATENVDLHLDIRSSIKPCKLKNILKSASITDLNFKSYTYGDEEYCRDKHG